MFHVLNSLAACSINHPLFIVDSGCTKAHEGQSKAFVYFCGEISGYCSFGNVSVCSISLDMEFDSWECLRFKRGLFRRSLLNQKSFWLVLILFDAGIWRLLSGNLHVFVRDLQGKCIYNWNRRGTFSLKLRLHLRTSKERCSDQKMALNIKTSISKHLELNELSERRNRTLVEAVETIAFSFLASLHFGAEAV
ncbi:hypothetical protein Tco_0703878 [Tanacetum coccineum]|uniref:Uncharacterized protein n=1 Tax=Tanacetum coccineum TaxID=301880 RepID=A0ABQ4Y1X9_9ASTR